MAVTPLPGTPPPRTPIQRFVRFAYKNHPAIVHGRRLTRTTKENLPWHGIALDDAMAVPQSPVRLLVEGETPDPKRPVANVDGACA
jgi:hypothetical protein